MEYTCIDVKLVIITIVDDKEKYRAQKPQLYLILSLSPLLYSKYKKKVNKMEKNRKLINFITITKTVEEKQHTGRWHSLGLLANINKIKRFMDQKQNLITLS